MELPDMSNFEDIDEALTPEDHARVSEAARARMENVDLNKDADLPSLFWDTKIDDPDNADMAAMAALMDELTPKERAENYKNRGNACMAHGKNKYYLRNAEAFYTRALAEACEDKELDSICLSNRAQANILLGEPVPHVGYTFVKLRGGSTPCGLHFCNAPGVAMPPVGYTFVMLRCGRALRGLHLCNAPVWPCPTWVTLS
jgi:predicted metal-binding transcription factor (methanogenesis marker protein 9)